MKIEVDAVALQSVLNALVGAPHYIRELQVTRNPVLFPDNPINVLIKQFNDHVIAQSQDLKHNEQNKL